MASASDTRTARQIVIEDAFPEDALLQAIASQEATYVGNMTGGRPSDAARTAVRYTRMAASQRDVQFLASPVAREMMVSYLAAASRVEVGATVRLPFLPDGEDDFCTYEVEKIGPSPADGAPAATLIMLDADGRRQKDAFGHFRRSGRDIAEIIRWNSATPGRAIFGPGIDTVNPFES